MAQIKEDVLAVDFDGVLHEYKGWKGNDVISEPPVPGAIDWLNEVSSKFKVVIYSARAESASGTKAIREWLRKYGAEKLIPITAQKPHFALMYVDDHGYNFDGHNFPTPEEIKNFKPWWKKGMGKTSLYDRLGGSFAIAAVIDYFSNLVITDPVTGRGSKNPQLNKWSTRELNRLPGLKFMRTLWVCDAAGGPQRFAATRPGKTHLGLEEAHRRLKISPAIFDEVAADLSKSLDHFRVGEPEKREVLAAFAAHKAEVNEGYTQHG